MSRFLCCTKTGRIFKKKRKNENIIVFFYSKSLLSMGPKDNGTINLVEARK